METRSNNVLVGAFVLFFTAALAFFVVWLANDTGGYYTRTLGERAEGIACMDGRGRVRQLQQRFEEIWERSRPVTEYRALGI